jgi:spore germination cell wall hydrolase CwlJ-like protein
LASNIYYEAKHTSDIDRKAVAAVTMNRVKDSGKSVCSVVYQKNQFSWTNNLKKTKDEEWLEDIALAENVIAGLVKDPTKGALYFWNHSVKPSWSRKLQVTLKTRYHSYGR